MNFFVYPAMGPHLERRVLYANLNPEDLRNAAVYPARDPRIHPDRDAWIANLRKLHVRWLDVARFAPLPFPLESAWARSRPVDFALRYADGNSQIWEVLSGQHEPLSGDRRVPR
jgi:hypothetical protein